MTGVFRRPFHRGPPRRIVHGVAGVVDVQAPGLHRRRPRSMVRRDPTSRKARTVPLLGVRQPGILIPVARMVMERARKILRARIRQPEKIFIPTFPPAVGAAPFPARPAVQRLPVTAAARRVPITMPVFTPAVGTPFLPHGPRHRKPTRMPIVAKRIIPGIVPGPGATPILVRPAIRRIPVTVIARRVPAIPGIVPGLGPTPIRSRQPAVIPPRHHPVRPRPLRGSLFVPGGVVFFIRQPRAIRISHRFRIAVRFTITAPVTIREVVTVGPWSAAIIFNAGDCLLIIADGPAKTDPNIRVNINLTPQ